MAKKPVRRKISAAASSSKPSKVSAKSKASKVSKASKISYRPKSARGGAKSSKKRKSYKEEYIKLLEKTNKTLTKEVKAIRKAIEQPKELPPDYEAFPKEEPAQPVQTRPYRDRGRGTTPQTIEEEILGKLTDIEMEIRSRDSLLDDLVHGSPIKLAGGGFDGN